MSAAPPGSDHPASPGGAAFPWAEAAEAAFGLLRLSPRDFWRATPRELAMALAPFLRAVPSPPTRAGLDALIRRFPDER